ncbi:MAG TPA: ABC transporter substrate-binding protein, partial [Acetobacteraceae bacterium]|nr:ABC transporter substrate-binding protein [Acetobacteraceae bacterium]
RDVRLKRGSPLGTVGTGIFNCLHPPFDKPAVRRAVLRAISQADFMTAAAGTDRELWRDGVGIFTPGTPLANDAGMEAITGPRDLDRSRRELREAGHNGERVVMLSPSDQPVLAALGEVGADLFRRLGMEVDFRVSDWGTLVQRRASREPPGRGGWNMFHTTWNGLDGINPGVMTFLRANGPNAWFGWPDLPRLEELRLSWFDTSNLDAQKRIATEIQREALESAPYLPTGLYYYNTAYRRTITEPISEVFAFWGVRPA